MGQPHRAYDLVCDVHMRDMDSQTACMIGYILPSTTALHNDTGIASVPSCQAQVADSMVCHAQQEVLCQG
jgi:hypothetical protein